VKLPKDERKEGVEKKEALNLLIKDKRTFQSHGKTKSGNQMAPLGKKSRSPNCTRKSDGEKTEELGNGGRPWRPAPGNSSPTTTKQETKFVQKNAGKKGEWSHEVPL